MVLNARHPLKPCQTFSITRDSMACQCQTFDNSVKHMTPECCRCATCVTFVQHVSVSLYLFFCYTYYMRNNFKQYQTFFPMFSTTYHFYLFFLHFVVAIRFALCLTLIIETKQPRFANLRQGKRKRIRDTFNLASPFNKRLAIALHVASGYILRKTKGWLSQHIKIASHSKKEFDNLNRIHQALTIETNRQDLRQ